MEKRGILVLKYVFNPLSSDNDPVLAMERPVLTFGKREARAVVVRDFQVRQELEGTSAPGLANATLGPGLSDFKSFFNGIQTQQRFLEIARASAGVRPWITIASEDRHEGRVAVPNSLLEALNAWDGP